MNKNIDFNKLKLGQLLWDVRYGSVIVSALRRDYPITAITIHNLTLYYDKEGKACIGHSYPVLYLKPLE